MPTPLRALILEDKQADARLVVHELRQAGFDLQWERVDSEAEYRARLDPALDIILSDYSMPQFDAIQALHLLRESKLDIPFIIVSGSIGEDIAVAALKLGAADYLLKDRLERLGQAVKQALDKKRLRDRTRQSEQALRESEERLRSAFDYSNVAMALTDLDHRFVRLNAAFAQMFGYSHEEMLQMSVIDITHADDLAASYARREALKSGEVHYFQMEKRYIHKDGHILWGLANLSLIRNAQGQPVHYFGQVQDITERKHAEAALVAATERLQHVVSSSPALLYTLAVNGNELVPVWVGENITTIMGYSVQEALDPNWWNEHIHPEDRDFVRARILQHLRTDGHVTNEYRFRHQNGEYRWVRSEKRLLRDAGGKPLEVIGSWSDITGRRLLEEQYRQAQKMEAIGKLAGGVAHDFNNLLTVIMGYSEMCLRLLSPDDPLHVPLTEIHKAGERATGLTRQLLAFSRRQVLMPVVLDLNAILIEMEKMLHRLIGEDITLTVLPGGDLWCVKADPGQMEQVVMNIAVNARDAMPTGGKLLIETKNIEFDGDYLHTHGQAQAGEYVLLAISDSGTGMAENVKARIFEPFFTTKGPSQGTGLGLATVFGIIKQSGGHLEVYSEVGQGTTFKIYLPRDRSGDATAPTPRAGQPARGGSETILLVEDEAGVRALAKIVLQKQGYQVIEAQNGGDAILICETQATPIHLLVTDVVMPNISGRQLTERLAAMQPKMKVLFMSGYTDDAIVHHGVLESGMPFLQKPFTTEALARKVREVLDQPRKAPK